MLLWHTKLAVTDVLRELHFQGALINEYPFNTGFNVSVPCLK
jgi:hypothetical protein